MVSVGFKFTRRLLLPNKKRRKKHTIGRKGQPPTFIMKQLVKSNTFIQTTFFGVVR